MNLSWTKILILSNVFFIIALWWTFNWGQKGHDNASDYNEFLKQEKEERFKDKQGYEHLKKEVEVIKNGKSLKNDPEWNELLKKIDGLKPKNVVSASVIGSKSEYFINIRDSVKIDSIGVRCYDYDSPFLSLHGCEDSLKIAESDSIASVLYDQRKKLLFLRIGKLRCEQKIINFNPNSTIKYSRTVVVQKKKRRAK